MLKKRRNETEEERLWGRWMCAAQEGDHAAYERLLQGILPVIRRHVASKVRQPDVAEDVVQNVLLSIHRSRHTFHPLRPFAVWLRAVTRNATIDSLRASGRYDRRHETLENHDIASDAKEIAFRGEALSPEIVDALDRLSDAQRQAIDLLHVRDLSVAEAAKQAGASESSIKVRAHRGRLALRKILEGRVR